MTSPFPTTQEGLPFVYGDPVPVTFFDGIQDFTGVLAQLDLVVLTATSVRARAAAAGGKSALGLEGAWRWIEANVDVSMPGGSAAGRYTVWATASAYAVSGVEDSTDYTFSLAIVKEGGAAPSGGGIAYTRVIGYLDWSGTAITRLVQIAGRRDDAPVAAASTGFAPALEAIMPGGSTANPMQALVGGAPVFQVSATGGVTATGGYTGASVTLSRNDLLAVSLSGAAAGMTFGGDTTLGRAGSGLLTLSGSLGMSGYVQANNNAYFGGKVNFGPAGGSVFDTTVERISAGVLRTNSTLQTQGNVALITNTGAITWGSANDTNLYRSAAGVLKSDGALILGGALTVGGNLFQSGTNLGFFNIGPVTQRTGYSSSPVSARTTLDYTASIRDVVDYVLTLTRDLKAYGLLA